MKKSNLLLCCLLSSCFFVSSCSSSKVTSLSSSSSFSSSYVSSDKKEGSVTLKLYDIDDVLLSEETLAIDENIPTVYKGIYEAFSYRAGTNAQILAIGNQTYDPFYQVSVTKNDTVLEYNDKKYDDVPLNDGDVITISMKCKEERSENDLLVDKAIYHYAKRYMRLMVSADTTFDSSDYWTYMSYSMMRNNGYDNVLFTPYAKDELLSSVNITDFSSFSDNPVLYGKYYYTMQGLGKELPSSFSKAYQGYLTSLSNEYPAYGEYTLPFSLSPSKKLGLTSENMDSLLKGDYLASTDYGKDGLVYQVASEMYLGYKNKDSLSLFSKEDQGNGTSTALLLLPYAACGEDASELIQILIDNYYDEDMNLFKVAASDTATQFSTNQIYASLMAYKCARDYAKGVSLFE